MSNIGEAIKKLFQAKKPEVKKTGFDAMKCTLVWCEAKKESNTDLCCRAHWNKVPASLKRALWKGERERSFAEKERKVMAAAQAILDHLDANERPLIITESK